MHVTAGRTAILAYTTLLWVTPIAVLFFKQRAGFLEWMGVLFGLSGVVVLFAPWSFDWHNSTVILGNATLLLAALCWAIAMLCTRYMSWQHTPLQLLPWQFLASTILVLPLMFLETSTLAVQWSWTLISTWLFTGILATALGTWGVIVVSKELSLITTSLSLLAVPVCGILSSTLILQEVLSWENIIAILLISTGVIFSLFRKK